MNFTSEDQRYDYPLTADSVVVDVGGFHGDFAARIAEKYGCAIWCFEPITEFRAIIRARNIPRLTLLPCALGSWSGITTMCVAGDSTGFDQQSNQVEHVALLDAADALAYLARIDLLKLNIEGAEYAVLRRLIAAGAHRACRNIQVQFHHRIGCEYARESIRWALAETHEEMWCAPFIWESWRLRE